MPATLAQLHAFAQGGASHASMSRGMRFTRDAWLSRLDHIMQRARQAAVPLASENDTISRIGRVCELGSERIRALGEDPDESWMRAFQLSFERLEEGAGSFVSELRCRSGARGADSDEAFSVEMASEAQAFASLTFGSLISFRNVLEQQMRLNTAFSQGDGWVRSIVRPSAPIQPLLEDVVRQVAEVCEFEHDELPSIEISAAAEVRCTCVPAQLSFALSEILKNAVAFSVAAGATGAVPNRVEALPKIALSASSARGQLVIRVADRAGGMDPITARRAFLWGWSSDPSSYLLERDSRQAARFARQTAPLSGLGVGLPLAHLHARYMGGHVTLCPEPGAGTEAFLTVANDGSNCI